jgi:hypothetical protein
MTIKEYEALPELDPKIIKMGEKYRPKIGENRTLKEGSQVCYYEVIRVTTKGYEAEAKFTKLKEK